MIQRGLRSPTKVVDYVSHRYRDYRAGDRITFDHDRISITSSYPDFSRELFDDVMTLERAMGFNSVDRSLEIGCGYGRLTPWIARYSDQHYAIEPEAELIETAEALYPDVSFECGSAQELPYGPSEFDLVVSFEVLQHVPDSHLSRVVSEIERVADEDAVIALYERISGAANARTFTRSTGEYESRFSSFSLAHVVSEGSQQEFHDEHSEYAFMIFR